METIQLAITNASYASALRDLLARTAKWRILNVEVPDPRIDGVLVVDSQSLERLPSTIANPERVVLITQNDAPHLAKAWEAGIVSVVYENDPINTAILAIMATRLKASKVTRPDAASTTAADAEGTKAEQGSSRRRELL